MSKALKTCVEATQDQIAQYAYYLWECEGRPAGRDLDYWLQAEAHLKSHQGFEAELQPEKTAPTPVAGKNRPTAPAPAMIGAESVKPARKRGTVAQRTAVSLPAQAAFA